ncbi:MAG: hypothetical protein V3W52_16420 [Syntrophobacteria bacterium]
MTGFPFDFAQDREPVERPVEPRISSAFGGLVRNDGFYGFNGFNALNDFYGFYDFNDFYDLTNSLIP